MAADLIDEVARQLGVRAASRTRDVPLLGGRGTELAGLIRDRPGLAEPLEGSSGHLCAEVVHACRFEGALHLDDVLERRTRLALTSRDRGLAAAAPAAALMADELGWDHQTLRREVIAWRARVAAAHAAEGERTDERALAAHRKALADRREPARR